MPGPEEASTCGDNICQSTESIFSCSDDCGSFNMDTVVTYCMDDDETTPCFWGQNTSWMMLFGGGAVVLALSVVKLRAPGVKKKVSPYTYVKIKYKKGRSRWKRR